MMKLSIWLTAMAAALLVAAPAAMAGGGDRNRDGIPDKWARAHKLSQKSDQASRDADKDGVDNLCEYEAGTDPRDKDSDDDGKKDAYEDADRDHFANAGESKVDTDCDDKDSDNDGTGDGAEDSDNDGMVNEDEEDVGSDPASGDTDGDGIVDGDDSAGKIYGKWDGLIWVVPHHGGKVGAKVTSETEIVCLDIVEHKEPAKDDDKRAEVPEPKSTEGSDDAKAAQYAEEEPETGCGAQSLRDGRLVHRANVRLDASGAVYTFIAVMR